MEKSVQAAWLTVDHKGWLAGGWPWLWDYINCLTGWTVDQLNRWLRRLLNFTETVSVGSVCQRGGVRWRKQWEMEEKKAGRKRVLQGYKYCAITVLCQPSDSQTITAHYLTDLPADSLTDNMCVHVHLCVCVWEMYPRIWFVSQSVLYLSNKSHQVFIHRQKNGKDVPCAYV